LIFIIGGNGFVGSAVVRYCKQNDIPNEVITKENYHEFVGKSCKVLINSNGNSKKFLATQDPKEDFRLSVTSVRSSLVDFKYEKYVFFSSCDVYNDCSDRSLNHEEISIDISSQSPYGFHKYLAEQCVRHAAPDWLIIRFGGFVGEGLKKNPIYDILQGGPLWVHPKSELQYLNTDAAASIVMNLIDRDLTREVINLCGDGLVQLESIVEEVGTNEIEVKPNSPKIMYNVNVDKAKKYVEIPQSKDAVLDYLRSTNKGEV
jgi:nucleoside-diphosphate-sugar epimerase